MKRLALFWKPARHLFLAGALALAGNPAVAQVWTEVATIAPKPTGSSVAIDGDTALTGSPDHSGMGWSGGAAFVHERDLGGKGNWGKRTKLLGSIKGGEFGIAVAISGDIIVVGAHQTNLVGTGQGAAYVFERDLGGPGEWGEAAVLFASDGSGLERFGATVGVWGDTAVAGAYLDDELGYGAGAAYVYQRDHGGPGAWGEVTKLTASDGSAGDGFGKVAIWKDTIAVGASWHAGARGAVYIFERDLGGPNAWGEAGKVMASDGVSADFFGRVELWGDTLAVGAPGHEAWASESGAVYVYERANSGPWNEQMKLIPSSGGTGEWFGGSLSQDGRTLIVGTSGVGKAFRFEYDPAASVPWVETQVLTRNNASGFGYAVAVGPREAVITDPSSGEAYVYEDRTGVSYCTAGTSASGCRATLSALGTPSATAATGFFLEASDVEGASKGLFFFGTNGRQANPWGNGTSFQCVVPPAKRAGVLPQVGKEGTCEGAFTQDLNARWCPTCPKAHHNPGAGAVTQAQLWYRDRQNTSNQTTSFSDAIEFVVAP